MAALDIFYVTIEERLYEATMLLIREEQKNG
jgi:hypothetical protein